MHAHVHPSCAWHVHTQEPRTSEEEIVHRRGVAALPALFASLSTSVLVLNLPRAPGAASQPARAGPAAATGASSTALGDGWAVAHECWALMIQSLVASYWPSTASPSRQTDPDQAKPEWVQFAGKYRDKVVRIAASGDAAPPPQDSRRRRKVPLRVEAIVDRLEAAAFPGADGDDDFLTVLALTRSFEAHTLRGLRRAYWVSC